MMMCLTAKVGLQRCDLLCVQGDILTLTSEVSHIFMYNIYILSSF